MKSLTDKIYQVYGQVYGQVDGQVNGQVGGQVWRQVEKQLAGQVYGQVWRQGWSELLGIASNDLQQEVQRIVYSTVSVQQDEAFV